MKKIHYALLPVLAIVLVLISCSCSLSTAKKAEKRLVETAKFVADSKYEETTLTINEDKTYLLYIHNYETDEMETYEGTWSYVMTYEYKYTVTHDPAELIKTTERSTWHIFKLDGYLDRGKQGYLIHKKYGGKIHCTSEEMNKNYFEQYKEENGVIWLPGWDLKVG